VFVLAGGAGALLDGLFQRASKIQLLGDIQINSAWKPAVISEILLCTVSAARQKVAQ